LIILTLLFVPYQSKRLFENSLERIVNLRMGDLLVPNNIENRFERKSIRDQLSSEDGIDDYNTIFTKMDTIKNLVDGNGFLYRYSFKSKGLSPWSREVSVPRKLGDNIVFDGVGFIDLKVKK
jgi:hypothetical protein